MLRHLITASCRGDEDVRLDQFLNAAFMGILVGAAFIIWAILRKFIFPEFNPSSYWDLNGNFWKNIFSIATPIMLYSIFIGQLDWFSDDEDEDGTLVSENIFFKGFVSVCAGLFEELGHRGIFIYIGLIVVYLTNLFFNWLIAVILIYFFVQTALIVRSWMINIIAFAIFIGIWLWLRSMDMLNPVYLVNEFILNLYQSIASTPWILYAASITVVIITLILGTIRPANEERSIETSTNPIKVGLYYTGLAIWIIYAFPKGIDTLTGILTPDNALHGFSLVPAGADKWTGLLYVSAIMWSNMLFYKGHKYQGHVGMLHSYVFGLYMIYVTFTFGLLYAIALHFLFDLLLFSSEHLVQVLKNWKTA